MPTLTTVRESGNQLVATFDDGSQTTLYPAASGLFVATLAGVPQGGGGESKSAGGTPNPASPGTVTAPVDDYPWPNAPQNDMSPLRYSYRDCTDFVAWRINRDNHCTAAPWQYTWSQLRPAGGDGDAIGWRGDWQILHYAVDIAPVPGCIAWYGHTAGDYGHVAYVQSVNGSTVTLEEYNWGGTQAYNRALRTVGPSGPYYPESFLAIP